MLLDSGAIVALLDRSERHHDQCAKAIAEVRVPLITCEAVIAESCYLLRALKGAPDTVLENVGAGIFQIPFALSDSAPEIVRIYRKYRDRQIDLADACLVELANRFETSQILTLDRDFRIYRWGRSNSFEFLLNLD